MRIVVFKLGRHDWGFKVVAANGTVVAVGHRTYSRRRNALAAAELIAGSRLKVVAE